MSIKVLLVDDDEAFRAVTAIALESEGCAVREAPDGYAALDALKSENPDVIISDLDMPGLDGLELCHLVRANPRLVKTRFVLLSALIDPDGFGTPLRHEADCCLSKQLQFHQLFNQIESLTNR